MAWLLEVIARVRSLFRRRALEREMAEEMRLHLEHLTQQRVAAGMAPDEARYAAQRKFGHMEVFKEDCRDGFGWRLLDGILRDVAFGVRVLRKHGGYTLVAALTLAFCIGANTAIFSMVYALLLKPLPFPHPTRIVQIYNQFPTAGMNQLGSNFTQYADYKNQTTSYEAVGLWSVSGENMGDAGKVERVTYANCTAEMFAILGIKPLLGQFFTLENSRWAQNSVIVLTQSFWESYFHADPGVLGTTIHLQNGDCRIVGVAPRALEAFDARVRFIKPMAWMTEWVGQHRWLLNTPMYARLKPGVPISTALAEAEVLEKHIFDAETPPQQAWLLRNGHRMSIVPVQGDRVQSFKSSLYLLQLGALLVLLIGCANIANLQLVRANARQSELAIRAAIGASRGAIARQLIIESLLLTLTGAVIGLALAWGAVQVMNRFSAQMLPDMLPIHIDRSVLGCAIALTISVGLLVGALPAVLIWRSNLVELIHRRSGGASGGRRLRLCSGFLVVGQVAVALILLSGAGLLIHSFAKAIAVDPGFDPRDIVAGTVALPWSIAGESNRSRDFQRRLLQSIRELPGVEEAALANGVPFRPGLGNLTARFREVTEGTNAPPATATQVEVSVGYFQALHIPLVAGRYLEDRDTAVPWHSFVVDEHFAKLHFPGQSAVGAHLVFVGNPQKEEDWPVIVGVVGDVPQNGIDDRNRSPSVYSALLPARPNELTLFARTARNPAAVIAEIRQSLAKIAPSVPLFDTGTLQHKIDASFDRRRAAMLLLGLYAGIALLLSAIGIYGVLAYDVAQRTREIGVRGAIGASPAQIVGLIIGQGLWKTALGAGIGLASAIFLSRWMADMLYALKPTDPWTYVTVTLVLAAVALVACYLPARRAAGINPAQALRVE